MRRSFTLIELLVTIGIVVMLAAFLTMGLIGAGHKAKTKGTAGLIGKVKLALDAYYGEFRDYPPDGFDAEPPPPGGVGWTFVAGPNGGVTVGYAMDRRVVRGTSSLIYFLARSVVNLTFRGDKNDPRNRHTRSVGPFLKDMQPDDFSMAGFSPGHPWFDDAYWDTQGMINCVIIDKFYRPIIYDKVKINNAVYFQPNRWMVSGTTPALQGGSGLGTHMDQQFVNNQMTLLPTNEGDGSLTAAQIVSFHLDPRFTAAAINAVGVGEVLHTDYTYPGNAMTHEPKNVGHYDLWSYGSSYLDPRDDVTSWEN